MFTPADYQLLHRIAFSEGNPGYRPNIIESPNGDGNLDYKKKYAHIAKKYMTDEKCTLSMDDCIYAGTYLKKCTEKAIEVAIELGIPKAFWPSLEYSALRVIEYPPGAITHPHTDFNLFTLMCYRNIPDNFKYGASQSNSDFWTLEKAKELNSLIHFGEILEIINPSYTATSHEVVHDSLGRTQYSIVFFAVPDHEATLPTGQTVGDWLDERSARSRKEAY